MATFNEDPGVANAQDWTGASRGINTNRAMETLFEGLGSAVVGAAGTADVAIQKNIKQDVRDVFGEQNAAYGLDEAAGYGTAPNSSAIPPDLADAKDRFSRMANARAQGKLSESHYWSMLATQAKRMRAKYPGYQDQIDQIFQDVTGAVPANALQRSLQNDYDAELRSRQESGSDIEKEILKRSAEIGQTEFADYFQNPSKYAGREREVLSAGIALEASDKKISSENLRLSQADAINKLNDRDAKQVYAQNASEFVMRQLTASTSAIGFDAASWMQRGMEAKAKGTLTPEVKNQLIGELQSARFNVEQQMNQMELQNGWTGKIPASDRQAIREEAMSTFKLLDDAVKNDNYGLAAWASIASKDRKLDNEETFKKYVKGAAVLEVLQTLSPAMAEYYARSVGGYEGIMATVLPGLEMQVASGKISFSEAIKDIDASKLSGQQRSDMATKAITTLKESFNNPDFTDQNVRDFVTKNFSGNEFASMIGQFDEGDAVELYNLWTTPDVVDRIAKVNDPKLLQDYAAVVYDQFDNIPHIKNLLPAIASYTDSPLKVMYDEKQKILVAVEKDQGSYGGLGKSYSDYHRQKLQQRLDTINGSLRNMVYVQEKAGNDPTPLVENMLVLNRIGKIQEQEGGEGASPLDSTPELDKQSMADGEFKLASFIPSNIEGADTILEFIGQHEAPLGYNQIYGKNKEIPLDTMTLDQTLEFQREYVRGGSPSSAVGKYQFIRSTLASLKEDLGLTGEEVMNQELQDKLAVQLLKRRGLDKFKSGKLTAEQFQNNLAKEWASLPTTSGMSYYAGDGLNNALTSSDKVQQVLAELAGQ